MTNEEIAVLNNNLGTLKLGTRDLLVNQPTRSDLFSFWKYCRKLAINQFDLKEKIAEYEDLPGDIRKPLINALIIEAKSEPAPAKVWEAMSSPEGVAFLTFLLTREVNKVELKDIKKLINEENVDDILIQLEDECGMRVITENLHTDPLVKMPKSES